MPRGSNLVRLADFNQAVILDAVRRSPGISRVGLMRESGLASQTISNITRRLIDDELLREGDPIYGRGRPVMPLTVNADGYGAIGVHVDPARLTICLLDLGGDLRRTLQIPTPPAHEPRDVVGLIADAADQLIVDEGRIPRERVLGIGIAAPGPIDTVEGVVLDPPQMPNWRNVRLRADLRKSTDLPVLLDKDVTAAATAELRSSPRAGTGFVFLYLGSGVAAGVVSDGQVLRGTTNNIGEVGDILVDRDAEDLGWSGRRGGLAAACVPEALVIQAAQAGILTLPDLTDYRAIDAACTHLCANAASNEPEAAAIIERSARRVSVGIGVLVNLLDVERVVLGGPLWPRLRDSFLAVLPDQVQAELVARNSVTVEGSAIGEHVAAQGAAELVIDHFLGPRPSVLLME